MKFLRVYLVVFMFLCVSSGWSQTYSTKSKKAIKLFKLAEMQLNQRDFDSGMESLEKALNADDEFIEAHIKLAHALNLFGKNTEAKQHFQKAADLRPDNQSMSATYNNLANIYLKEGDYVNAKKYFEKVVKYPPQNLLIASQADDQVKNCEFAIEAMKNPLPFEPRMMSKVINSQRSQAYPVLTADKETMILTVTTNGNDGPPNENIMVSYLEGGEWTQPRSLSENINSNLNEGTASISADGRTLVFTACNRDGGMGSCDLYMSRKVGEKWSSAINMGENINSRSWESEASLSADGKTIYFTSRRGNRTGIENIWYSKMDESGIWSQARSVGPTINNEHRQVSPFIHADGRTLFFASTGHPGMGGFDLYKSYKTDTGWTVPVNLGYPVNTQDNEATIFITPDYSKGYYAKAERTGPRPEDHMSMVYEFDVPEEIKGPVSIYAKGKITDAKTGEELAAEIELIEHNTQQVLQSTTSDPENGNYLVVLTPGTDYGLFVKKEGYLFKSIYFDYREEGTFDPLTLNVELDPIEKGRVTVLNNIFFETGKFDLQPKSMAELQKLVDLMEVNSSMRVEVSGHTDNVGSDSDNLELSKNRARAVKDYLIKEGVNSSRLISKGFGESKPKESNDTEAGRAVNRRIEFKVL